MKKYTIEMIINSDGKIVFEVDESIAPITVNHFVKLVKDNFYEGTVFHRVIKDFMIQTGGYVFDGESIGLAPNCDSIKGEFMENGVENNLKHTLGVVSMARTNDPNSASGQFFICSADCPWLDGKYAAFGKVTDEESLKNVLKISNMETCCPHPSFQDFPVEIVQVTSMKVIGEVEC